MAQDYEIQKTVDSDGTEHVRVVMKNDKDTKETEKKKKSSNS